MARADAVPVYVPAEGPTMALERMALTHAPGTYTERWLQDLVLAHPEVLPLRRIDTGFGDLIPICAELELRLASGRRGFLDALLVTPDGDLVIVETKLWRNPEARRSVVAQALDYAAALFAMDYEALDAACRRARPAAPHADAGTPAGAGTGLADLVAARRDAFDEAAFCDAITRNLREGRALVCVVGDGIHEDAQSLTALLQRQTAQRFIFALVELGIWSAGDGGGLIVTPSILMQTTLVERSVVRLHPDARESGARVADLDPSAQARLPSARAAGSISEDRFFDELAQRDPDGAEQLRALMAELEPRGVYADFKGGLSIKFPSAVGNDLNLASIHKNGVVNFAPAAWFDRKPSGRAYHERLADATGLTLAVVGKAGETGLRRADGSMPRLGDILPDHRAVWIAAMDDYTARLSETGCDLPEAG